MLRYAVVAAFLLFNALDTRPSWAEVTGPARVIVGVTIVVAGERIDAPELRARLLSPRSSGNSGSAAGTSGCRLG